MSKKRRSFSGMFKAKVALAAEHAETYFDEQAPVDPKTEEEILVITSDCKGVPMRKVDAPGTKRGEEVPGAKRKRLKKGEKNGQKRLACVGGAYSVAPFRRTAEDLVNEILRKQKQTERPKPRNKRLRAELTREVDGREVNAKDVIFDWLAKEVAQRDPHERRTVVAVMDGETKLRDLQELKIRRAIGILDIWHVTEYLWKLAYCFHPEGSDQAEAFVETYLRKLLEGKVRRVIGGIRQMVTKARLSKHKRQKARQYLNYFAARCDYMKYDEYLAAGRRTGPLPAADHRRGVRAGRVARRGGQASGHRAGLGRPGARLPGGGAGARDQAARGTSGLFRF